MSLPDSLDGVYQLRVSLRGVSPPVWRRLLVPGRCSIRDLHYVLQTAMGWEDEHLHRFCIRGWHDGVQREGAFQCFAGPSTLKLCEFGFRQHERFSYEYNFYASGLHDIRVDQILAADAAPLPRCIGGARACPQEACRDAADFMEDRDEHRPISLFWRFEERVEEEEWEVERLREERRDWAYWIHIDRFDRAKVNTALGALKLSCSGLSMQESVHENHREVAYRKRSAQ